MSEPQFVTSSFCLHGDCVAVAVVHEDVVVRDTKTAAQLTFTRPEWEAFLAGVQNGEFSLDALGR